MERLTKSTLLSIFGVILIFVIRFIGTISPSLSRIDGVSQINSIILILSSLFIVSFFVFMLKEFAQIHQSGIIFGAKICIIASLLTTALYIFRFAEPYFDLTAISSFYINLLQIMIPLTYSVSLLIFFIFFFLEGLPGDLISLRRATITVITATSFMSLLNIAQLFNFIKYEQNPSIEPALDLTVIGIPFVLLKFWSMVKFLTTLYKLLKQEYWD